MDSEQKLALCLELHKIDEAFTLLSAGADWEVGQSRPKVQSLGDLAVKLGNGRVAIASYKAVKTVQSLFLIASAAMSARVLREVGEMAQAEAQWNVALMAFHLLGHRAAVLQVLQAQGAVAEMARYAQAYNWGAEAVADCVQKWKNALILGGSLRN